MTSSNRVLNRIVLSLVGVVLIAVGGALILSKTELSWVRDGWERGTAALSPAADFLARPIIEMPGEQQISLGSILAVAAAVLLIGLLLFFAFTRGRGRQRILVRQNSGAGRTTVDHSVARGVFSDRLGGQADAGAVHTEGYDLRRSTAIRVFVRVRRGAELPLLLAKTHEAVREWDELSGTQVPVLLHLSRGSWKERVQGSVRVR